jgi:uncharacterized membrane protein
MHAMLARLLLALAYPWIAHAATARGSATLAALALADIALIVLLPALLARRPGAWLLAAALAPALVLLARSAHAQLPLLLVPVAFIAMVSWAFGRTLRDGRVPLITRIVSALDGVQPAQLAPDLARYTRNLTATWAIALAVLAGINLLLALLAVPAGLLASAGIAPPLAVSEQQWSWFANVCNYGLLVGLFVGEYLLRKRRFPGRYASFADFLRRMAALGPVFWRDLLREPATHGE